MTTFFAWRLFMARMSKWIALAAMSFALSGCVSADKFRAVKLERDRLASQLGQAEAAMREAQSEASVLRQQNQAILANGPLSDALKNSLMQQNADLQKKYDDAMRQL